MPFLAERAPELWLRLSEHILLTGISTLAAVLLGMPLGILAARLPSTRPWVTGLAGILQTVPSLALLALLLALLNRIGTVPALIALILYALLPIVRNTLTGLTQLPDSVLEAADGMGMTHLQRLRMVELPLAAPVILAGIRTAAVACVGIATLSAFIGAGGLGQFINRGLSLSDHRLILLGAIPSALLALLVDAALGSMQRGVEKLSTRSDRAHRSVASLLSTWWPTLVLLILSAWTFTRQPSVPPTRLDSPPPSATETIIIGSKNFTEQLILGELMAQAIEKATPLRVVRKFDLGGTMICHQALAEGALDLYAEYTGTGWTAILREEASSTPPDLGERLAATYRTRFDLVWLPAFGFNNTYTITVRETDASVNGWTTISDLRDAAPTLRAGWTFEFSERPDGYPGLRSAYGFAFGQVVDLESTLMYQAIAQGEIDVICAFATDGRIQKHGLRPLRDDREFFPPYQAAPVIRADMLRRHPQLRDVLESLAGTLSDETMRELNVSVETGALSPRSAAASHLASLAQRDSP